MSLKLLLRVQGVGPRTLEELEKIFDSYQYIDAALPEDLKDAIPALSDRMIKDIKGLARKAIFALAEAPQMGNEDYELIIGLAAINEGYADLIPKNTSPDYKEMVQAMMRAVYEKMHEPSGISLLNMQSAKKAFEVSEDTVLKYLKGESQPNFERLNDAVAVMAWHYKKSKDKEISEIKEVKVLPKIKTLECEIKKLDKTTKLDKDNNEVEEYKVQLKDDDGNAINLKFPDTESRDEFFNGEPTLRFPVDVKFEFNQSRVDDFEESK